MARYASSLSTLSRLCSLLDVAFIQAFSRAVQHGLTSILATSQTSANPSPPAAAKALAGTDVMIACDGYNFADPCWYINVPTFNDCYAFGPPIDKVLSSMYMWDPLIRCYFYSYADFSVFTMCSYR